jgi:EmrB/QacA subfamily drug resistance transporter
MAAASTVVSHRWWTLAAVSLTQLLIALDATIVNIALPSAQADLGFSDTGRQWVVTAYALPFGACLLLGGRVADYWGRKRTYLLGLAAFGLGSAWGGVTDSSAQLLAARGVQGLAAAVLAPAALSFVTIGFPSGPDRIRAFAVFGSLAGAGSAAGTLLGGVLTQLSSWRWCLLVSIPVVVIGLVAGWVLRPESRGSGARRYDVPGAVTVTLGFACLVYGLTLAEQSWTSPATVSLVGSGATLVASFVVLEMRATNPLLPLRILKNGTRAAAFGVQALLGAAGMGTMVYLAFHLQSVLGLSPLHAGLGTLPFTAALMGTVPFAIRMFRGVGPRRQMVVGPLVSATGMVLLTKVTADGGYWTQVFPAVVLMGVGMALAVVPLNNLALLGVADTDAGVASAATSATNQIGGSIGLAVLTAVYVTVEHRAPAGVEGMVAGHSAVFGLGAGILVVAALVAALLVVPKAAVSTERTCAVLE